MQETLHIIMSLNIQVIMQVMTTIIVHDIIQLGMQVIMHHYESQFACFRKVIVKVNLKRLL